MTKIVQIVNSFRECPNRHYYSGGAYECMKVQPSRLNADMSIPGWCPLTDYSNAAPSSMGATQGSDAASPPLIGTWHHGQGYLVSGTIRIARWDCDTNPPEAFRDSMLDWICATLNAAVKEHERTAPDEFDGSTPGAASGGVAELRDAKAYAIEHAGYMADAARHLLDVLNRTADARMTHDDNPCEGTAGPLAVCEEWLGEATQGMTSAIYEFEKRRDRATAAGVQTDGGKSHG
jgi:hypothetical protein